MATQDMPPPGGFASIKVERTFAKPLVRQGIWFGIIVALTFNGFHVIKEWKKKYRILKLEQMEHFIAAQPFLVVEQERLFLEHLYNLREDERELMKDHPNWQIGTLYGEPVFKTLPPGVLPPVHPIEYATHRSAREWQNRVILPDSHQ